MCTAQSATATQGLALSEQMVPEVPTDTFDLPLDVVVTPDRVYYRDDAAGPPRR